MASQRRENICRCSGHLQCSAVYPDGRNATLRIISLNMHHYLESAETAPRCTDVAVVPPSKRSADCHRPSVSENNIQSCPHRPTHRQKIVKFKQLWFWFSVTVHGINGQVPVHGGIPKQNPVNIMSPCFKTMPKHFNISVTILVHYWLDQPLLLTHRGWSLHKNRKRRQSTRHTLENLTNQAICLIMSIPW